MKKFVNCILALLFSVLIQADTENFWGDSTDTSTKLFADAEDTLDLGADGWEDDDDLENPDSQPITDEGVPMSLGFSDPFGGQRVIPKEGKIDLCWIIPFQKPYCCDGLTLPDGIVTGCMEYDSRAPRCNLALNLIYCCYEAVIYEFVFQKPDYKTGCVKPFR